ncbi:hypothetical protein Pa4123_74070 [Phytohabitans aurantiacus]|uniref:Uncharacterized protein n=2 Tax=Phytohabitans aurantiacus TaxID=3016789 RepID=A0ABQ5R5R7_9ACTN|nr:hypothetical protein Pa4123_74070 [Phytohabitans aurantiacus]
MLLGDRKLLRQLRAPACAEPKALAAVLYGLFSAVLGRLCQGRFGPAEIRAFAEQAAGLPLVLEKVTAEQIVQVIELEVEGPGESIDPRALTAAYYAVILAAARELRFMPGDVEDLVVRAERLAAQGGYEPAPYSPGVLMRLRFDRAELRRYGWARRDEWAADRSRRHDG